MIKKRLKKAVAVSLALVLGSAVPVAIEGQQLPSVLPVEPPSSLFSARIGDEDVEVFAQGFWEAVVLSTGTWSSGASFHAVPILFTQTPDLYTFLGFKEKWLFEAYVTQEASNAMFLLAFEGDEDDFVKSARLGNSNITMPAYPFLGFGAPAGSFGVALDAYDAASGVSVDAMIRWDGLSWRTRTIFGGAEAQETAISPADELRGRRFALPDRGITGLTLVDTSLELPRILASDEYSVSLSTGIILLAKEPAGTLAASYTTAGGTEVFLIIYEYTVDGNGNKVRADNQYEVRNLYALSDSDTPRQYFVRSLASGTNDAYFTVSRVAPGLLEVVRTGALPDPADLAYMRPFNLESPWVYEDETQEDPYAKHDAYTIIARGMETVDAIILDDGTVEGTISVYRDAVESASFLYDAELHSLTLSPEPQPGELVQVRYAVASTDRSKGALAFGLGSRLPWLGLDWSIALGGRWPLAGSGFDEGGELSPAWTGLSLGVAAGSDDSSFDIKTMVRYQRAGTFGLYRILGMEDYGVSDYLVPLRPADGTTEGVAATVVAAADLETGAFGNTIQALHPTGIHNQALALVPGSNPAGDPERFIRYIEYVPLSSFRTMSFFVKAEEVSLGSMMTLKLGNGTGDGLSVMVPLDGLGPGWHKISVSLDPLATLSALAEDGTQYIPFGASTSFIMPDAAGRLELVLEGFTSGVVTLDEFVLEDEVDGFVTLAGGSFHIGMTEEIPGESGGESGKPRESLYLSGTGSSVFDDGPAAAATILAGWNSSFAQVRAKANPAYGLGTGSLGLGYSLAAPSRTAPTRILDEFSRDEVSGRYARSLEAALSASGFTVLAQAASSEESSAFGQKWKASVSIGNLFSARGAASLMAPVSALSGLGILDAWVESWNLVLPVAEALADSRRLEVSSAVSGSVLTAIATRDYELGSAETTLAAKASVPFSLGVIGFSPFYIRTSSVERDSGSVAFISDFEESIAVLGSALEVWKAIPIIELWDPEAFTGFGTFSSGAGFAEHSSGPGLELRRPIGYGLVDLFLPSTAQASIVRVLSMKDDSLVESSVLKLAFSGGAANLFAGGGILPLLESLAFDEYSYRAEMDFAYYPSDGALLPTITANHAASMEGEKGSVFAVTSNFSFKRERDAMPWSETLGLALTTKPDKTWFGDLVGLAIQPGKARQAATGKESTWVSEWLELILADAPALQESFLVEGSVRRVETDGAPIVALLTLDYSTKAVAAGSLTAGFGAKIKPQVTIDRDTFDWRFGYELSLMAKVVF